MANMGEGKKPQPKETVWSHCKLPDADLHPASEQIRKFRFILEPPPACDAEAARRWWRREGALANGLAFSRVTVSANLFAIPPGPCSRRFILPLFTALMPTR
jgi:hypothetical protein